MSKSRYDAHGMVPDPQRVADAEHIKRNPVTDEITWPTGDMLAVLREMRLIDEKDHDT